MSALTSRVDEIDVQIERIARLIDSAQQIDRELAAGLACQESMTSIQGHVDRASASVESLDRDLRKWKADRK
ncbi:hypothetical protein [Streptosporangium sp. NPDC051022]|uniref:hypothetical protein n=1 Tax=Streptosporangium sp. NPDC051022 TaxID=3155752 RepID=UPI003424BC5A